MGVPDVPVARRMLFSERRRALLGIAGITVSLLLMLTLDAIFAGATRQLTRYIDSSPAAVFVSQTGVRTMHMSTSVLPAAVVNDVRAVPGVAAAVPILYAPDTAGELCVVTWCWMLHQTS